MTKQLLQKLGYIELCAGAPSLHYSSLCYFRFCVSLFEYVANKNVITLYMCVVMYVTSLYVHFLPFNVILCTLLG